MTQCRNCQTPFEGSFCPSCGQKDLNLERPLWELLGEIVKETLDLDGRAYQTMRTLLTRPGVLTREYLAGRRRLYTPPLRLYLAISVSFFILVAWLASRGFLLDSDQTVELDAASQARFMSEALPRLMFLLLPAFALMVKVVFPRLELHYGHDLNVHMVVHSLLKSRHIESSMIAILRLIVTLM